MSDQFVGSFLETLLNKPGFQQAWREMADVGLESEVAIQQAWDMVLASPHHAQKLADITNELVAAAGHWACSVDWETLDTLRSSGDTRLAAMSIPEDDFRTLQKTVANKTATVAACYLLIGVLVGVMAGANIREDVAS